MYIPLPGPALDRLSAILFSPSDDVLAVASFDDSILLYNCQSPDGINPRLVSRFHAPSPVLTTAYTAHATFTGLLDGSVRQLDYENMKMTRPLLPPGGVVSDGINHLRAVPNDANLIVASSFGGCLSYIDPRTPRICHQHTAAKIFAVDVTPDHVTVARAGQTVDIFDLRSPAAPCITRPSGLRYQVTALRCFPSGDGYALSSIDGRVSVEYYAETDQDRKYAFKCHRHRDVAAAVDMVYPVTQLLFHRHYDSMLTCGADGHVCVWNWHGRKRMKQFPAVLAAPAALSHMDVNHDGTVLVVGASDDLYLRRADFNDAMAHTPSKVYLRQLSEAECKPKA